MFFTKKEVFRVMNIFMRGKEIFLKSKVKKFDLNISKLKPVKINKLIHEREEKQINAQFCIFLSFYRTTINLLK